MPDERSRLNDILDQVPTSSHVLVQTIAACAISAFERRWPGEAEDMAAIVCGRWVRKRLPVYEDALAPAEAHYIDRLINAAYAELDDERIRATEQLFEELFREG